MTKAERFAAYVVERSREELGRTGLDGGVRAMLEAFVRDGEEITKAKKRGHRYVVRGRWQP